MYFLSIFERLKPTKDNYPSLGRFRVCAWFETYDDALDCLYDNKVKYYNHGEFPYALIEFITPGENPESTRAYFFKYDDGVDDWRAIREPEYCRKMPSFAIG